MSKKETIDTTNLYMVAVQGNEVVIMRGIPEGAKMSKKAAMNLAAWLVALGDEKLFNETLEAVQGL